MNIQLIIIIFISLVLIISIFIFTNKTKNLESNLKNLESNLKNNDILDKQHYEYLQKLVNKAVYEFNSFDPTKVVQPIGTIIAYAGTNIPANYKICDGSKLLIAEYTDLFKIIGVIFNNSDTDSTLYFNLPDLRGQFIRGLNEERNLGSYQNDSTKLPDNSFITNVQGNHMHITDEAGLHSHHYLIPSAPSQAELASKSSYQILGAGTFPGSGIIGGAIVPTGSHKHTTNTTGDHSHVISGGDPETRPKNIALYYIIKTSI